MASKTGKPGNEDAAPQRAITRADELRARMEDMIIDGTLAPGERLDEMELARRFGVSRTPVREAIKSLMAVGLVEFHGRQGTSVAMLSIPVLIEMFELMAALEGICAGLAARRASAEQKARLRSLHEDLIAAYEAREPEEFYRINAVFHDVVYEAAKTYYLADQTIRLRRRLAPYRMRVTYQPGRMKATLDEHLRIIEAIEAADPEAANKAAADHVRLLGDQLSDFIASIPADLVAAR